MLLTLALSALADDFPTDPILRVETGTHSDVIQDIDVDEDLNYLVTSSYDRTLRVWSLAADGSLMQTLRPPIGKSGDGQLYTVAMSPDGSKIAAAGQLTAGTTGSESIYVFDRVSGAIVHTIDIGEAMATELFVAGDMLLWGGGSCNAQLIDLSSGDTADLKGSDDPQQYVTSITGPNDEDADWFVVACSDGTIRFYDYDFQLLTELSSDGPIDSVAYSPDDSLFAVGYTDRARIDVYETQEWGIAFVPQNTGDVEGGVTGLGWSEDGSTLFAIGSFQAEDGRYSLRRWAHGGRGAVSDTAVSTKPPLDLVPISDDLVVYGAADSTWGVVATDGEVLHTQPPAIADFEYGPLLVSDDATRVAFAYSADVHATFDVGSRLLVKDGETDGLKEPTTNGLQLGQGPTANGVALEVDPGDVYNAGTLTPDGGAVVGGSFSLVRVDKAGKQVWGVFSDTTVNAVNVAGDYVVTAQSDGAVRWHDGKTGDTVLSLLPHADHSRWALWTANGYYDASPGGTELVGFHVNRGAGTSGDFFPATVMGADYNRPDVVDHVLALGSDIAAWEYVENQAKPEQVELVSPKPDVVAPKPVEQPKVRFKAITFVVPPVVKVLTPAAGSKTSGGKVTITASIRADEAITGIRVLVDGRPVPDDQLTVTKGDPYTIVAPVPDRDVKVSVLAKTATATSDAVFLDLCGSAGCGGFKKEKPAAPAASDKPALYVLAIGVSDYATDKYDLGFPAKDATDFVSALMTQQGPMYSRVETKVLTNDAAKKDDILEGLEWIATKTKANDVAAIFLSGHGVQHPVTRQYFFMPHDADQTRISRTMVQDVNITSTLGVVPGRVLMFMDTCHSGAALTANSFVNSLSSGENGVVVFFSSSGKQTSQESDAWGNGAFTKAVVEGLTSRKADPYGTGAVTVDGLGAYLAFRVKQLTSGAQTPTKSLPKTTVDFAIAATPK